MLASAEVRDGRNSGRNRTAQEHIRDRASAALLVARIHGRVLTAELNVAPGLANLQQVELIKPELWPHLEPVFPVHKTESVIQLDVLGRALGGRVKGFAEPMVSAESEPCQSVDGWFVRDARKFQAGWRIVLAVCRAVGDVMNTVKSDTG